MILTGNETYTIDFTGSSHVLKLHHKPNEIITIKCLQTGALNLTIDNSELLKFRTKSQPF